MDWSSEGVDWRDSSLDEVMARDWLIAARGSDLYGTDVYDRVLELLTSDLDPERGWRLVKKLVDLAQSDEELLRVGADALSPILEWHAALVSGELEQLVRAHTKYRRLFKGQISSTLYNFERQHGFLNKE